MIDPVLLLAAPLRRMPATAERGGNGLVHALCSDDLGIGAEESLDVLRSMHGINGRYDVIDTVDALAEGSLRSPYAQMWLVRAMSRHPEIAHLRDISAESGVSAWDDCRVLIVLLHARNAGLLDDDDYVTLFDEHVDRARLGHTSWGQYYASCALGLIAAWQGTPDHQLNVGRTLGMIHGLCHMLPRVPGADEVWPLGEIGSVLDSLAPLLPIDDCRPLPACQA